jgi:toluene monooxygenase system protein D
MGAERLDAGEVGPVLLAGRVADAVVEALRARNAGARVSPRGSYVRVSVPGRCLLDRAAVERALGEPFRLPQDLERVMPSFRGRLVMTEDVAAWEAGPVVDVDVDAGTEGR